MHKQLQKGSRCRKFDLTACLQNSCYQSDLKRLFKEEDGISTSNTESQVHVPATGMSLESVGSCPILAFLTIDSLLVQEASSDKMSRETTINCPFFEPLYFSTPVTTMMTQQTLSLQCRQTPSTVIGSSRTITMDVFQRMRLYPVQLLQKEHWCTKQQQLRLQSNIVPSPANDHSLATVTFIWGTVWPCCIRFARKQYPPVETRVFGIASTSHRGFLEQIVNLLMTPQ